MKLVIKVRIESGVFWGDLIFSKKKSLLDVKNKIIFTTSHIFLQEDSPLTPKCGVSVILPSINEPTNEGIGDNCSMTKTVTENLTNLSSQVI